MQKDENELEIEINGKKVNEKDLLNQNEDKKINDVNKENAGDNNNQNNDNNDNNQDKDKSADDLKIDGNLIINDSNNNSQNIDNKKVNDEDAFLDEGLNDEIIVNKKSEIAEIDDNDFVKGKINVEDNNVKNDFEVINFNEPLNVIDEFLNQSGDNLNKDDESFRIEYADELKKQQANNNNNQNDDKNQEAQINNQALLKKEQEYKRTSMEIDRIINDDLGLRDLSKSDIKTLEKYNLDANYESLTRYDSDDLSQIRNGVIGRKKLMPEDIKKIAEKVGEVETQHAKAGVEMKPEEFEMYRNEEEKIKNLHAALLLKGINPSKIFAASLSNKPEEKEKMLDGISKTVSSYNNIVADAKNYCDSHDISTEIKDAKAEMNKLLDETKKGSLYSDRHGGIKVENIPKYGQFISKMAFSLRQFELAQPRDKDTLNYYQKSMDLFCSDLNYYGIPKEVTDTYAARGRAGVFSDDFALDTSMDLKRMNYQTVINHFYDRLAGAFEADKYKNGGAPLNEKNLRAAVKVLRDVNKYKDQVDSMWRNKDSKAAVRMQQFKLEKFLAVKGLNLQDVAALSSVPDEELEKTLTDVCRRNNLIKEEPKKEEAKPEIKKEEKVEENPNRKPNEIPAKELEEKNNPVNNDFTISKNEALELLPNKKNEIENLDKNGKLDANNGKPGVEMANLNVNK